jgi:hypothetical protein
VLETEKDGVPEREKGDIALTVVKAGVSAIPFVGGPAAELFGLVVTPSLDKRREEWMHSVANRLKGLEEKVKDFRMEDLSKNEEFISTLTHASQAALRSHQQEKLDALRNAVLNVAVGVGPDENVQLMFVNLVDNLTPLHLRILRFFQRPESPTAKAGSPRRVHVMGTAAEALESAMPELRGRQELYELVARDLHAAGLLSSNSLTSMATGPGIYAKRTTDLGDQFVRFITYPN